MYSKLCIAKLEVWIIIMYTSFIVFSLYTKVRSLLLRKSFEGYNTHITGNFRNIFADVNLRVQDIQYQHLFSIIIVDLNLRPQHIYYQLKTSVDVRVINYKLRTLEN